MSLEGIFKKIGASSNTPTAVMCLVAIFKGIMRPTFTMMDKESDPETKKYAAIREGLTEVAALPLYAATPFVAGWLAKKIAGKIKGADVGKMEANAKFLGLGIATLLVPAVCNLIQPPIMNAYKKSQDAKKAKIADVNSVNTVNTVNPNNTTNQPAKPAFNGRINYGMKVGG